jgi:hypothetical protein
MSKRKSIIDIADKISSLNIPTTNSLDNLLTDQNMKYLLDILEISNKYQTSNKINNMSTLEIKEDILKLGSLIVSNAVVLGYTTSLSHNLESTLQYYKATVFLKAKKVKFDFEETGNICKVTDKDFDALSKKYDIDILNKANNANSISDILKYVHYSAQELVKVLTSVYIRMFEEKDSLNKIS